MFLSRLFNLFRSQLSYLLSMIGVYRFRHKPVFLSVEPADRCMLRCPQCPVGMRENHLRQTEETTEAQHDNHVSLHTLSPDLFRQILDECASSLFTIQFFFQGEPLLCKHLPELIRMAKQHHIYTIVSTNGLLLTEQYAAELISSGIDKIIISIDGYSQQSYEQYRVGGNLDKALQGLRQLADEKRRQKAHTVIEWQCLMLSSNQHEWESIRRNYRRLGADRLSFKTAQFYDYEHGNPLMPAQRYSRYRRLAAGTFVRKKRYHNYCRRLWQGAVVDANGNLLPCCFDKDRQHSYGNLSSASLLQLWHSSTAHSFRRLILRNRQSINICLNCTE